MGRSKSAPKASEPQELTAGSVETRENVATIATVEALDASFKLSDEPAKILAGAAIAVKGLAKAFSEQKCITLRDDFKKFVTHRNKVHGAKLAYCRRYDSNVPTHRDLKDGVEGYRKNLFYMGFDWYHRKFKNPATEMRQIGTDDDGKPIMQKFIKDTMEKVVTKVRESQWNAFGVNGGLCKLTWELKKRIEALGGTYTMKDVAHDLQQTGATANQITKFTQETFLEYQSARMDLEVIAAKATGTEG